MISRKLATVFSVPNSIDNTLPGSWIDHNPWPLSVNYEQKIHKNIKISIRVELEHLLYKSLCETRVPTVFTQTYSKSDFTLTESIFSRAWMPNEPKVNELTSSYLCEKWNIFYFLDFWYRNDIKLYTQ